MMSRQRKENPCHWSRPNLAKPDLAISIWPHLAKPNLANNVWPKKTGRIWPFLYLVGARRGGARRGGAQKGGAPKGGAPNLEKVAPRRLGPEGWGPEGWESPKFSAFFFSLSRHQKISLFLCLSGCLLVEFGWCLKHRGPEMCTFGVLGLSCASLGGPVWWAAGVSHDSPGAQTCAF